jgi:formate hydrogenlyase subunit 6/NADH:ubiquinone oxidoreductase subunit I
MIRPGKMIAEVLRSILRKPATEKYPAVKMKMPDRFRGKLKYDAAKCIGCLMCVRDCPTGAISIKKVGDRQFEAHIDLGRCIYCAQCVDSCPKGALEATPEFELAGFHRNALKVVFHGTAPQKAPPPSGQPQGATEDKTEGGK